MNNNENTEFKPLDILGQGLTEEGMKELAALLTLPDEQFKNLSAVVMQALEEMMNVPETKLALVQGFNMGGGKIEDLQITYQQSCDEVDKLEEGTFSPLKKDFLKDVMGLIINVIASTQGAATRIIVIPTELCNENAKMPQYAHISDAGMDVFALDDYTINPGETKLIPTGIKMAIPVGYEIQVRPKSGRCLKTKLRVANTPGTIDTGYRDELGVIIENVDPPIKDIATHMEDGRLIVDSIAYGSAYTIGKGEKFAQLVLNEVPKAVLHKTTSVGKIGDDRKGGFGSTGLK